MAWFGVAAATALIVVVFLDTFEAMILPRRVTHAYRPARLFYRSAWILWRAGAKLFPGSRRRQAFLSVFGPLSLLALLGLWASGLITGFALLDWSLGTASPQGRQRTVTSPPTCTSVARPSSPSATAIWCRPEQWAVCSVWPKLVLASDSWQWSLATCRCFIKPFRGGRSSSLCWTPAPGHPPVPGNYCDGWPRRSLAGVGPALVEWERWSAELLESHLSFPVLSFYRSQHDNQSWVAALTTILDTSALLIAGVDSPDEHQAHLTFAMARHAAVDLGLVIQTPPLPLESDRMSAADLVRLRESLRAAGLTMRDGPAVEQKLTELRGLYEPFVNALAAYFVFVLPPFQPVKPPVDNWQTSAWMRRSPGLGGLRLPIREDDHFD